MPPSLHSFDSFTGLRGKEGGRKEGRRERESGVLCSTQDRANGACVPGGVRLYMRESLCRFVCGESLCTVYSRFVCGESLCMFVCGDTCCRVTCS